MSSAYKLKCAIGLGSKVNLTSHGPSTPVKVKGIYVGLTGDSQINKQYLDRCTGTDDSQKCCMAALPNWHDCPPCSSRFSALLE